MTTRTFSLFSVCLLLGALMPACGGGAADNASNTTGGKIGVAECDDFIKKYETCVSKMPEASRPVVKANLDSMRAPWKKAAETEQGKANLAQGCKQALEQAKTAMGSYGCSW